MVRTLCLLLVLAVPAQAQSVRKIKSYLNEVEKHLVESYVNGDKVDRAALAPAGVEGIRNALKQRTFLPDVSAEDREVLARAVDAYKNDLGEVIDALDVAADELKLDLDLYTIADAAANAMVQKAGDQYGRIMSMDDLQKLQKMLAGDRTNESMGVAIRPGKDGRMEVAFLYYGFAGERAGLLPGDGVLKIDGREAKGLEGEELREALDMSKRDVVTLTIERPGFSKPFDLPVTKPFEVPQQVLYGLIGDDVGYLRLTIFDGKSARAVRDALKALRAKNVRGLIFDLRNNPGGDLRAANAIADEFVEGGKTIAKIDWSYKPLGGLSIPGLTPPDEYVTNRKRVHDGEGIPMVMLINHNSASASELVSGALKDLGRCTIVGENSYGKGVGQTVIPIGGMMAMASGGKDVRLLYLTILRYQLPNGGYVEEHEGVAPHVRAAARAYNEPEWTALLALRGDRRVAKYVEELLADASLAEELASYDDFDTDRYPEFDALATRTKADRDLLRIEVRRRLRNALAEKRGELWPYDLQGDEQLQRGLLELLDRLEADPEKAIRAEDMRAYVEHLASDEMRGREVGSKEGFAAADWVAARFKAIGLKPAGTDGYFQRNGDKFTNVLAKLEGTESKQAIVIGAHHDGQGVRRDAVLNSADDNASGVAMMLEIAEAFAAAGAPKRTVLFQSYDGEEAGFLGSRYFVESDLFKEYEIVAMICFDLVGGNFTSWEQGRIYALGSESSPQIREALLGLVGKEKDVEVAPAGVYIIDMLGPQIAGARSDYCAFRAKEVPYVFFSTGTPWYYHTASDDPERLDYPKMQAAGRFVFRLMAQLAGESRKYDFVLGPTPHPSDARMLADALDRLLENGEQYQLSDKETTSIRTKRDALDAIAKKDAVTEEERVEIQKAMATIFGYAKRRPR